MLLLDYERGLDGVDEAVLTIWRFGVGWGIGLPKVCRLRVLIFYVGLPNSAVRVRVQRPQNSVRVGLGLWLPDVFTYSILAWSFTMVVNGAALI